MRYNPGFLNSGMKGQPEGFEIRPDHQDKYLLIFKKTIYEFTLNEKNPLIFVHPDGTWYMPDRHFFTDQASIPRVLQTLVPKDRFIGPYLHDSCYRHKGLWVSRTQGRSWLFDDMLREEADELLRLMCIYDPFPTNRATAFAIWAGCRMGGWYGWGRGDERTPEMKNRIDDTKPPIAFA